MIDQVDLRSKQLASMLDTVATRAEACAGYLRAAGDKRSFRRPSPLNRLIPTMGLVLGAIAVGFVGGAYAMQRRR